MSGFRARISFRPRGRNHWLPGGGEADIPEGGAVGAASPLLPVSQHFFGLLYLEHLVEGDDAVDDLPHGDASLLFVLLCLPPNEPPVEKEDEEGDGLDAGADADVLVPEHLDIVGQAPTSLFALAGLFPEDAGRVDHGTEHDRARDVAEQPENDELDAKGEGLLIVRHAPQHHHQQGHLGNRDKEGHEEE